MSDGEIPQVCEHCGSEGPTKTVDYYGNDAEACEDCGALL